MSELPYMPVNIESATRYAESLTTEELGALIRIQWGLWEAGGYLDEIDVQRFARVGKRWGAISAALRRKLRFSDGRVSCPWVLELLGRTQAKRAARAAAGAQGGHATAQNRRSGDALKASYGGTLKSDNLLKINESESRFAAKLAQQTDRNQNQNPSTITSLTRSAKGLAMQELFEFGAQSLVKRGGLSYSKAKRRLENWLDCVQGDIESLRNMLSEAETRQLTGPAFSASIDSQVKGYLQQIAPPLPRLFTPRKASG